MKRIYALIAFLSVLTLPIMGGCNDNNDPEIPKPGSEAEFVIDVSEVSEQGALMKVTPSNNAVSYYFDVISKTTLVEYHASDLSLLLAATVDEATASADGNLSNALKAITVKGLQSYRYDKLVPKTEYIAFAAGLDAEGKVCTEIVQKTFTTLEIVSGLQFEVKVTKTYINGADYTITPSSDELYWYSGVRSAGALKGMTDAEILQKILAEDEMLFPVFAKKGPVEYTNEESGNSDTEYLILTFGYSGGYGGVPTTPLVKTSYRTGKPDIAAASCTFRFEVSGLKSRSAAVSIYPSGGQNMYAFDLIDEATYEQNKTKMNEYVANYTENSLWTWSGLDLMKGDGGYTYTKTLTPGTKYYVWAACIDEFGATASPVAISAPFTTLPSVVSDAVATAAIEKYFDGDDLFARDPVTYALAKGKVYVPVAFNTNEVCPIWYGELYEEAIENPSSGFSDADLSAMLTKGGVWCPVGFIRYCAWNTDHILLAVGVASDDNTGPLYRQSVVFTKQGAAPISEFVEPKHISAKTTLLPVTPRGPRTYKTAGK